MDYLYQIVAVSEQSRAALGLISVDPTVHKWSYTKDVLNRLPEDQRQQWNCNTCRKFFYNTINAVIISDDGAKGTIKSLVWDPENAPLELTAAAEHISTVIEQLGKFEGAFTIDHETFPLWKEQNILGKPEHGGWEHLSASIDPNKILVADDVSKEYWNRQLENVKLLVGKLYSDVVPARIAQLEEILNTKGRGSEKVKAVIQTYETVREFLQLALRTTVAKALTLSTASVRHQLFHLPGSVAGEMLLAAIANPEAMAYHADKGLERFDPLTYQRAQREATQQELAGLFKLVTEQRPGALDWVIATENEVELLTSYGAGEETPESPEQTDALSALERLQRSLTPRAIVEQTPVDTVDRIKISWERLLRDVLPKARTVEFFIAARTRATILMRRKNTELPSPLRDDGDYSVITTANHNPTEGFGLKSGWNKLYGTIDSKLVGNGDITVFVLRGRISGELYKRVPPPLFPESYKPEFFQYRKAFEELLQQSYAEAGTGEYAHILVPAAGDCSIRVTSDANVLTTYDVIDV